MKALMVQGTSSWAGKSLLVTAFARYFARLGIRVAPFKAQNMSNNARVVGGGEIGTAQWLQALAAGIEPQVRMNPVLVKPEGDDRSQVVRLGRVDVELSRHEWRGRAMHLWSDIETSLRSLLKDFELVLIEGAGSPAELNLWDCDVVNMRVAHAADAAVLLVADIDRGGAFAHLYGTWSILRARDRQRVRGFVLNKFRGDASLLPPAPQELERLTGVPTLGVVPWLKHDLPDEDGAAISRVPDEGDAPVVAVVRYPTASNLDEFKPLERHARLRWAVCPEDLCDAELVVLPGSKHVAADLAWLRARALDQAVRRHAEAGGRLLAICGGLQMLGERLEDPAGLDGACAGMALLPMVTTFHAAKTARTTATRFATLPQPWSALSGLAVNGYEIRHGSSVCRERAALPGGLGYVSAGILAVYVHGLFENPGVIGALFGGAGANLAETFDRLADAVSSSIDTTALHDLVGLE